MPNYMLKCTIVFRTLSKAYFFRILWEFVPQKWFFFLFIYLFMRCRHKPLHKPNFAIINAERHKNMWPLRDNPRNR